MAKKERKYEGSFEEHVQQVWLRTEESVRKYYGKLIVHNEEPFRVEDRMSVWVGSKNAWFKELLEKNWGMRSSDKGFERVSLEHDRCYRYYIDNEEEGVLRWFVLYVSKDYNVNHNLHVSISFSKEFYKAAEENRVKVEREQNEYRYNNLIKIEEIIKGEGGEVPEYIVEEIKRLEEILKK